MSLTKKADGAAGGRFAASLLGTALCAEVSHSSMDEDGAKIDLKLSFRNVFSPESLITTHCQVKHGASFRANSGAGLGTDIKLQNISSATLNALRFGGHPALLIWVPPPPSNSAFWELIPPSKKKKTPIEIGALQMVTPGLAYDVCRYYNNLVKTMPFSQVTLEESTSSPSAKGGRAEYRTLKSSSHHSPLTGKIEITRLAWRHITGRSRSTNARKESLEILSNLGSFLSKSPSRYATTRYRPQIGKRSVLEVRDLLLTYDDAVRKGDQKYRLLVRIREEIRYPLHWRTLPLSTADVQQRATLTSWWYKI